MIDYREILSKYKGKNVFITGHTGFKGSWMVAVLLKAGANVTGYSLEPPTEPSLFEMARLESSAGLKHIIGDVRDREKLKSSLIASRPDYVFHLAAQPLVRESYKDPVLTFETNVMGTVNLLEAVREYSVEKNGILSVLNVTTDKVYKNNEWCWGYREDDPLDGYDPYSNSKSCSELVTHSYKSAFFDATRLGMAGESRVAGQKDDDGSESGDRFEPVVRVSTARAGNVIGGGDFATDRIIPDCVRAISGACERRLGEGEIYLRNPHSIRPYQHVLDPVLAYLMIAAKQYEDSSYAGYYNVGPDESSCVTTGELVKAFSEAWDDCRGAKVVSGMYVGDSSDILPGLKVVEKVDSDAPHESTFLKLDCSKLKSTFGWEPVWSIDEALRKTAEFTGAMLRDERSDVIRAEMDREIEAFLAC